MIIFIHGEDTFRSQQRVNQLQEAFIKKYSKSGLNLISLDGAEITLDEFQKKCFSAGLLEKKRLIIIKNLISQNSDFELHKGVLNLLQQKKFPEENILIFWEEDIKEGTTKRKGIKKARGGQNLKKALTAQLLKEKTEEFNFLSPLKLKQWVQNEIKKGNGKIEKKALEELMVKVGQDLWQMNNEIGKLVNFCRGRTILEKDIHTFVQAKFDENIFHLTDALGQRQKEPALRLIRDQLESGTEPLLLLAKFIWQFRNLIQINELLNQKIPAQVITDTLKLHPFVVQKTIPQARRFTKDELKKIYKFLLDLDFQLKNTNTNPELLFDMLVMEVCK